MAATKDLLDKVVNEYKEQLVVIVCKTKLEADRIRWVFMEGLAKAGISHSVKHDKVSYNARVVKFVSMNVLGITDHHMGRICIDASCYSAFGPAVDKMVARVNAHNRGLRYD